MSPQSTITLNGAEHAIEAFWRNGDKADPEDIAEQQDEQWREPCLEAIRQERDGEACSHDLDSQQRF